MTGVVRPPALGEMFRFTFITNDSTLAAGAQAAGVDRIGVDLERIGKAQRQPGGRTRLSRHTWTDVEAIGRVVDRADLFVRLNPVHEGTATEVEMALERHARVLMLPFFSSGKEVEVFTAAVAGRARTVALVETAAAVTGIREVVAVPGLDEVMVGLVDLGIQMGGSHPLQVLASSMLETVAREVHAAGLPFGVGGLGRPFDETLPIDPELVYAQYPRLGATAAWLARSFVPVGATGFPEPVVHELRRRLTHWGAQPSGALVRAQKRLARLTER